MEVVESGAMASKAMINLPIVKQIGLMVGLAAAIAIGVSIADWSKTPDFRVLYSSLVLEDTSDIVSVLERANIKYRLSEASGSIMVPSSDIQEARMMLATEGLPKGVGSGYELLEKDSGFGVSHFMENIRYQRALEGELARTITSIKSVRSARVHLAIPKNTSFLRKKKKVTASVIIDLFPGRNVDNGQVGAITHLVAAGIPGLTSDNVVVVDQKGRLLSTSSNDGNLNAKSSQLDYRKSLEKYYISRIENILIPFLGNNSVRAQVSADIDFTVTEKTQEIFNPELPAVRSEQIISSQSMGDSMGGIPGSLSNQPLDEANNEDIDDDFVVPRGRSTSRTVRNYEIDKTISHIRYGGNVLRKLSVAVVIDNERRINESGEMESKAISPEKIEMITNLVKEAVGFNVSRGDSINVINAEFFVEIVEEIIEEKSFIDNPNVIVIVKYIGAAVIILILVFGLLKPIMKQLASNSRNGNIESLKSGKSSDGGVSSPGEDNTSNMGYESNIKMAQSMAGEDPKRVAQVVNGWAAADGG